MQPEPPIGPHGGDAITDLGCDAVAMDVPQPHRMAQEPPLLLGGPRLPQRLDVRTQPLDDDAQRTAGRAAAAAAVEETFGIDIDDFALGVDSVGGAFKTAGRHKITPPDPEVPQDTEAAAFFDVDNTLIQGSSLILLAQGLFRKRFISLSELAPALWKQIRYRVSGSENAGDIAEGREQAKALIGADRLITVYVQASPAACRERDPQGLYAAGGDNIPGISFAYDAPEDADLVIDTESLSVEEGAKQVIDLLRKRGVI